MKRTTARVLANTFWLLLQRGSGRILTLLLMVYLARSLGSLSFGKLAFAISFTSLFLILSDMGITTLTIREVARDKAQGPEYVGQFAILKFFLSVFTFLVIIAALMFMNVPSDTRIVCYLVGLALIFRNFGTFFAGVFQAHEDMKYVTLVEIIHKSLLLSACLVLLRLGYALISISLAYALFGIFFCLLNMGIVYWKFLKPHYLIRISFWGKNLKEALPLALTAVISMIYYNIDIVMLGKIKGEEVAGWYGASYHLYFALATIAGAFLSAAFPVMSRYFKESKELLRKVYQQSFKLFIGVGIPISVGVFLLSKKFILFFFGAQYERSAHVLKIFSLLIVFGFLNSLAGYFLTSINRQDAVAKIIAFTTGMNVILNLILIPRFAERGAASATVISEVLFFVLYLRFMPGKFRHFPLKETAKSLLSALLMGGLIFLMIRNAFSLPLIVGIAAVAYVLFLWMTGFVTAEERTQFSNLFRGERKV